YQPCAGYGSLFASKVASVGGEAASWLPSASNVLFDILAGNDPDIVLSRRGCAGVIELNRPKALNALSLPMVRAMHPRLLDWEADPEVAVVLIKPAPGSGKAFCAGGDIRAIADDCVSARSAETGAGSGRAGGSLSRDFFREEYALNHAIGTYKKPYVAFIDGITMAAAWAYQFTVFAMPETNIGFFPDVGGGFFLPRLHAQIGVYLALTGHRLSGEDVKKCGIASHFVNSE
uniref:3-hydroxyisobutyryl-CoA hydrolase, mitochondrial n=1 Tax=Macrostomum lignano TaxID=282301 RepID=A0A1I8G9A0_9PLAT